MNGMKFTHDGIESRESEKSSSYLAPSPECSDVTTRSSLPSPLRSPLHSLEPNRAWGWMVRGNNGYWHHVRCAENEAYFSERIKSRYNKVNNDPYQLLVTAIAVGLHFDIRRRLGTRDSLQIPPINSSPFYGQSLIILSTIKLKTSNSKTNLSKSHFISPIPTFTCLRHWLA